MVTNCTRKYFSLKMRGTLALLIFSKEGPWHACGPVLAATHPDGDGSPRPLGY